MKSTKRIAILLTALIASSMLITGCGDKKEESSGNSVVYHTEKTNDETKEDNVALGNKETQATAEADKKVTTALTTPDNKIDVPDAEVIECTVGEVASQKGIDVTLNKIARMEFDKDDKILAYATFTIKNSTSADFNVSQLAHFAISVDGETPTMETVTSLFANSEAKKSLSDENALDGDSLTSGNTLNGYIAFEVPASATEIDLTYYPYIYNEEAEDNIGFSYKLKTADLQMHE